MSGDEAWRKALRDLESWHADRDTVAARSALLFIEPELRLAVPPIVRRTWPPEQIEDVLREFLARLLERPLGAGIEDPRSYLVRAFRNRCIDLQRVLRRRDERPVDSTPGWEPVDAHPEASPDAGLLQQGERAQLQSAMDELPMADRVALKLVDAPEWLDDEELVWLSDRTGRDRGELAHAISRATDVFALTEIFDPPDASEGDGDRRHRMERFRKRRARAREKLRELLDGRGVEP